MAAPVSTSRSVGRSGRRIPRILAAELACQNERVPKDNDVHGEREHSGRTRHHSVALGAWNSRAGYFSPEWRSV
jgi:hypothetical protein